MKTRNYLLLIVFAVSVFSTGHSQQILSIKHRYGFQVSGGLNINSNTPDIFILRTKTAPNYSIGAVYEYLLNDRISLGTGLDFDMSKTVFFDNPNDDLDLCYFSRVKNYLHRTPCTYGEIQAPQAYGYTESFIGRKHRIIYMTIPLDVIYKTKLKSFRRFYGRAGLKNSFRIYSRGRDLQEGFGGAGGTPNWYQRFYKNDVRTWRPLLSLALGYENNYFGASSVKVELEYSIGLMGVYKSNLDDRHIYTVASGADLPQVENMVAESFVSNRLTQNTLKLKLRFLF